MVAGVSGGRIGRLGVICGGIVLLGAGAAGATDAAETEIVVRCPEVTTEEAAQVEARVRASLLSSGLRPASVELECDDQAMQAQVGGDGRRVLLRASRSATSPREALLVNADAALSAWLTLGSPVAAFPVSAPVGPAAAAPSASAPQPAPQHALPCVLAQPALHAKEGRVWLSAGLTGERWQRAWALGPQLGLERSLGSAWWIGGQLGYLLASPRSARFSASELQFGGQLGWQPSALLGVRGALTFGLSALHASPESGVSAQNGTTSTLPFVGLDFSRPVDLGPFALLPSAGLRGFLQARTVELDAQEQFELPVFALHATLNLALKLGG